MTTQFITFCTRQRHSPPRSRRLSWPSSQMPFRLPWHRYYRGVELIRPGDRLALRDPTGPASRRAAVLAGILHSGRRRVRILGGNLRICASEEFQGHGTIIDAMREPSPISKAAREIAARGPRARHHPAATVRRAAGRTCAKGTNESRVTRLPSQWVFGGRSVTVRGGDRVGRQREAGMQGAGPTADR